MLRYVFLFGNLVSDDPSNSSLVFFVFHNFDFATLCLILSVFFGNMLSHVFLCLELSLTHVF